MKETTIEIRNWKSVLDAQCIEHWFKQMRGVHHGEAYFMSGTATVHYDEAQVSVAEMREMLDDRGLECMQSMPQHAVMVSDPPAAITIDHTMHADHAVPMEHAKLAGRAMPMPAAPAK